MEGEDALDGFAGLTDVLEEKVVGQKEFIKKLVISFKRPYVMPPEGSKALNAILLTGRDDTGKHFALTELAGELKNRKILRTDKIEKIDLGIALCHFEIGVREAGRSCEFLLSDPGVIAPDDTYYIATYRLS